MERPTTTDDEQLDLMSIGETMVAFVSRGDQRHYVAVAAGAESNVAVGMARLGCRTQWVSRIGDDPLGRLVEKSLLEAGVAVEVVRDGARPTGLMTIHVDGSEKVSAYYRSDSAATLLSPADLKRGGQAAWTHVTGITPALSVDAADMVTAAILDCAESGRHVSFDVNFRPRLWPDAATASDTLVRLAQAADVVFIGDDEAHALFGSADPTELARTIITRDGQVLVLKRGPGPASVVTASTEISEPALPTEIVETTGAGDAFAAGYLAATVFGWPIRARLRLGHVLASKTVSVIDHVPPPLTRSELDGLSPAALEARWSAIASRSDLR